MATESSVRPMVNGRVIGLGLGQYRFVGGGVAVLLSAMLCAPAMAGPKGAKVTAGNATIRQNGARTVIRAADRTIIDYSKFDIGRNETVRFIQPSADARVLNRISGSAPTQIDGTLRANGNVYFVNRAGVIFGPNSVVNVGGIFAAAGSISNSDFLSGINRFTDVTGRVENQGRIDANVAALIGERVSNSGQINSPGGIVAMVSGNEVTLSERGGTMSVKIDAGAVDPSGAVPGVENSGSIKAGRGSSLMVAGDMYSLAIKNTGSVKARNIQLEGQGSGEVRVAGSLDASDLGGGGRGGKIQVTGETVRIDGARIDASGKTGGGEVLIGGDVQGTGQVRRAESAVVTAESVLNADARGTGDGGKVVVWSDGRTGFYGTASATGGKDGGNGGFIETSGKVSLDVRGAVVRANATSGRAGLWLMDPVNVNIADPSGGDDTTGGSFSGGNPDTFTPDNSVSPAVVDVNTINLTLNGGTSVTILTGSVGTDSGNITVSAPISKTLGGDATLTLHAANNVVVSAPIGSTTGQLNVNLQANASGAGNNDLDPGAGDVTVNAPITTNGGTFNASGVGFTSAAPVTTGGGNATLTMTGGVSVGAGGFDTGGGAFSSSGVGFGNTGQISTGGGMVGLSHTGAVNIQNQVLTGGGGFTSAGTTFDSSAPVNTAGGNLAINHSGNVAIGAPMDTGGGTFNSSGAAYVNTAPITTTGGAVTINHTGNARVQAPIDASGGAGTSSVSITAASLDPTPSGSEGIDAPVIAGSGGITLQPNSDSATVGINSSGSDFTVSAAELAMLSTTGTVTIGRSTGTGAISIGGLGDINLLAQNYDLAIRGGAATFDGGVTLADDRQFTLRTAGASGPNPGVDVTVGGTTGSLLIDGTGAFDLNTSVRRVAATTTTGGIGIANVGTLEVANFGGVNGVSAGPGGNIVIGANNTLTVSAPIAATGAGTVTLTALGGDNGDISVAGAVSSETGTVTLQADDDIDFATGGSVSSTSGMVTATADFDSSGTGTGGDVSFAAGTSITTGAASSITISADGDIMAPTDPGTILTAGTLNLTTAEGKIGSGDTLRTQAGTIVASGRSGIDITNSGDLIATLTSTMGTARLDNTGTLITGGDWGARGLDITSTGNITLAHDAFGGMAGGVSVTSTGGTLTINNAKTLSSNGGAMDLSATDLILDGAITNMGGDITITRSTAGTVGLGAASGDMQISGAELIKITADKLTIGPGNITEIRVDTVAAADSANIGLLALEATENGGKITFGGGDSTFKALDAKADDGISVNADLSATDGILALDADADGMADTSDKLTFGAGTTISTQPGGGAVTLAAATGGIEGAGALTVNSGAALAINSPITVMGALTLSANGGITLSGAGAGEPITITADDGVTISDNLTNTSSATNINADADGNGMGTFTLASGKTINTGNNDLNITAADVVLDGSITAGTGAVAISPGASGTIGLGLGAGTIQLSGDELSRISARVLNLGNALTTLVTVDGVGGSDTAGITTLISILADDIDIAGGFNTGSAGLAISRGTTGNISVAGAMGGMNLSSAELQRITAPSLQIGGGLTNNITVTSAAAGDTANIGTVLLQALNTINFSGPTNTFKALTVRADNGINVNTNLTTTVGDLVMDGDADGTGDTLDSIVIGSSRTLTSAGLIDLKAQTQGISGVGALTLLADNGVHVRSRLTGSGTTTINADHDGDNSGTFTLDSGSVLSSSGSPIVISANDIDLGGTIDGGAGSVAIVRSGVGTIGLGTASGNMTLSGAELGRITATGLTIGNDQTSAMTVDSVAASATNSIAGVTTLTVGQGGAISFAGTSVFNTLTALAQGGITVGGSLSTDSGALRLNGDSDSTGGVADVIRLNSGLTAPNSQDIDLLSDVVLGGNITVAGKNVRFMGDVNSDSTSRSLIVNTSNSGTTLFGGGVGTSSRLFTLTTNADGITRLGGDIRTNGTITINDALRLINNSIVDAQGGLGVFFNSTVDTALNAASDFNLIVRTPLNASPNAVNIPIISFAGQVGGLRSLNNVYLNYNPSSGVNGHVNVPVVATVVARPRNASGEVVVNPTTPFNMLFNCSGEFGMGQNEKVTSGGSLTINAASARLGDLTSVGNMTVNAPSITLLARQAALVLGSTNSRTNPIPPGNSDMGLDFVSGGTINFSSVPTLNGSQPLPPSFATPGATGISSTLFGFFNQAFGTNPAISNGLITNTASNQPAISLDLRAQGPTTTDVATALAGAIPPESRAFDVGQNETISEAQAEDLKQLGVLARSPSSEELLALLSGSTTYDDFPRRSPPTAEDYTTVVTRLPAERVTALLNAYDALFNKPKLDDAGNPVINPATGQPERVSRTQDIQNSLLASVRRYRAAQQAGTEGRAAGDIDPVDFKRFLETGPEEGTSLGYIRELGAFLNQLDQVGLTSRELAVSKNVLLNPVRPRGIRTVQQLEAIIRANPSPSVSMIQPAQPRD